MGQRQGKVMCKANRKFYLFHYTNGCLLLVIGQVSIEVVYLLREVLYKKDGNHRKNLE